LSKAFTEVELPKIVQSSRAKFNFDEKGRVLNYEYQNLDVVNSLKHNMWLGPFEQKNTGNFVICQVNLEGEAAGWVFELKNDVDFCPDNDPFSKVSVFNIFIFTCSDFFRPRKIAKIAAFSTKNRILDYILTRFID
jgi:hypothetical protein